MLNPTEIVFANEAVTTISYSDTMRELYGRVPKVDVFYWDEDELAYIIAGQFTSVRLIGYPVDQIIVDHGGANCGLIKIS